MTRIERFARRVQRHANGCWLWTGPVNWRGYGHAWDARRGKTVGAHRLSYELHIGQVPDGLCVLHVCDTRRCIRPDHLWLGTNADNVKDRDQKGRGSWGHSHAHLRPDQVADIRRRYGHRNGLRLAAEFGIHSTTLYRIVKQQSHRPTGREVIPCAS